MIETSPKQLSAAGAFLVAIVMFILAPVFVPKLQSMVNSTPSASVTPTPSATSTPSQQAKALISQFFTDINNRDYQNAYNIWSTPPRPYDQFASGYANTRHDDIFFDNITPLSDGTVSVAITINATEDTSGGTMMSTYQGTYIVGIQNGAWKIFSGKFNKTG